MKKRRYLSTVVAIVVLLALAAVAYAFSVGNVDGVWGEIDGVTAGPSTLDVIGGATTSGTSATLYPNGADHRYVRNAATCRGDPDGDTNFVDWTDSSTPTWTGLGSHSSTCSPVTGLIISEYVYDQINNRSNDRLCVEIYNGTGAAVNLGNYSLRFFSGGLNSTPVALTNTSLANNDVWVVCNTAGAGQTTIEDQTWSNTSDSWRTVALYNENETAGARCNRWATGNGNTPTAISSGDLAVQTGPNNDENQVRYGRDAFYPDNWQSLSCDLTNFAQQSGFGFDGNDGPVSPESNTPFYLGKFTHYNNQVFSTNDSYQDSSANALTNVDLTVTVPVTCKDGSTPNPPSLVFTPNFALDETGNTAGTCAYGSSGDTPCPDKVTVDQGNTTATFTCPDGTYTINILGFQPQTTSDPDCSDAYTGAVATEFITQEDTDNVACLWAEITAPEADIRVAKTCLDFDTQEPYYKIITINDGPGSARQVTFADTLPAGVVYSSYTSQLITKTGTTNQGTCSYASGTRVLSCQLLTPLPAPSQDEEAQWVVTINVTLAAGSQENTVTVNTLTFDRNLTNNTSRATCDPTEVDLLSFTATPDRPGGIVTLAWTTASEINNLGFNLYRATAPDGERTLINPELIASQAPGGVGGATYTYIDPIVGKDRSAAYYYWLESVDFYDGKSLEGPVEASLTGKLKLQDPPTK